MLKKRNLIFLSLLILGVFLITGCWLIPSPTYTVTFDSQGGSAVDPQMVERGGLVIEPTAPTRTGYAFSGWYEESGCTNAWDFNTDTVTSDVTLYARWATNTYTVTFNSQGGSAVSSQTVEHGGKVTKPTNPTRAGYTFGGWYKESGCTNAWAFATDTVTSVVTLYAQWTTNTYTVTFDKNGGNTEANPKTKTATHGGNVGTLPTEPTRADYIFTSWNTKANGSGTEFTAATAVTANLTVYAQWASSDATLSALSLSSGTLNPSFASATTSYIASVANSITSITVAPTAADTNATITVNGTPVASGSASGAISLDVGENTITTIVTAQDGTTTKIYTVTVTRETEPITAIGAITGKVREGDVLTAGALTPADATADYQWQICATVDGTYTNITGATSTTYTPVADDVTKFIKVVATGTGGYSGTVTSAATVEVVAEGTCVAGDSFRGGIVAYRLQFGDPDYDSSVQHGLIAALADYSTKIYWHATNDETTGATETALGTGQANTDKIIALYGAETNAARVCYDYTNANTGTGVYSDWFLPSKDELNKLWLKEAVIGGFANDYYWSSSEYNAGSAWSQQRSFLMPYSKTQPNRVRAVRAF